jgi:surface antigen
MKRFIALAAVAAFAPLGACGPDASKADTGTLFGAITGGIIGNQFGKGSGKVASTFAGAVVGGIVGNSIGRDLDERDRILARDAEYDAWERGTPGRPVRWSNPANGRYGDVVAEDYYDRGGSRCRNFVHTVYIDGRPQSMRGTACRNPDGTWTQVG